ncbi:hypothetical protein QYF36_021887 [Acer negundo]|nr:hypothetical protein QYF36_021887 [Acer negundo]
MKISPVEGINEMAKEVSSQQEPGMFDPQQRSNERSNAVRGKMKVGAVSKTLTHLNGSGPSLVTDRRVEGPCETSGSMKAHVELGMSGHKSIIDMGCQDLACESLKDNKAQKESGISEMVSQNSVSDFITDSIMSYSEISDTVNIPKVKSSRTWKRSAREGQSNALEGRKDPSLISKPAENNDWY